ncbi:unnamed protein product [Amoebophrya sp. A25]|nr:unnamed protein product [Amoebophrya sp. A25]|eukprot:GSA25T00026727001.1
MSVFFQHCWRMRQKCCNERCLIDDHEIEIFHQPAAGGRFSGASSSYAGGSSSLGGSGSSYTYGGPGQNYNYRGNSQFGGSAGAVPRSRYDPDAPEIMSGRGWNQWGSRGGNSYFTNPLSGTRGPGGEYMPSARTRDEDTILNSARKYFADRFGASGSIAEGVEPNASTSGQGSGLDSYLHSYGGGGLLSSGGSAIGNGRPSGRLGRDQRNSQGSIPVAPRRTGNATLFHTRG